MAQREVICIVQAEGCVETAEELSAAPDDELTTIASEQIVSADLGDALACDSARSGGVKSAETAAGAGQNRVYGGDGTDAVTALGGLGKILFDGTGDDKISGSEGDDTFVLDLRRLTADETLDTINGFDPAADRLAFFGLTDAGAPLCCTGTRHRLERVTAQERHVRED